MSSFGVRPSLLYPAISIIYLSLSESGVQSNLRSCVWNVIFLMRFLDLAIFSSFRWLCLDIGVLGMDFSFLFNWVNYHNENRV